MSTHFYPVLAYYSKKGPIYTIVFVMPTISTKYETYSANYYNTKA